MRIARRIATAAVVTACAVAAAPAAAGAASTDSAKTTAPSVDSALRATTTGTADVGPRDTRSAASTNASSPRADGAAVPASPAGPPAVSPQLFGIPSPGKIADAAKALIEKYGGNVGRLAGKVGEGCALALVAVVEHANVLNAAAAVARCAPELLI